MGAEGTRDSSSSALRDAAYEATPLELQTGMPSLRALSARFAEMPEPGKAITPIGMVSSIRSLRLNGAALLARVHRNVAVAALANKLARIARAVLRRKEAFMVKQ